MKISITKEALLGPLQAVNNVVERRQTLPVLSNLLMLAENGQLVLTGTDMEVEVVAQIDAAIESEGAVTVPARKLLDIVKALPTGAQCDLTLSGEKFLVRSGRSRFSLLTIPARDFPALTASEGDELKLTLPARTLLWLIDATQFAMAHQDVRYYLNGLLLHLKDGGVNAVTTDGHRLALAFVELEHDGEEGAQFILPRKGVQEMRRLLADREGDVTLELGSNQVRLDVAHQTLTSKLIDGNFPEYERVVPVASKFSASGDRVTLRDGLHRAAVLSNEKFRGVRATFEDGVLKAVAHNPDHEEAEEEIPVEFAGGPVEIGFNVGYLLDVLNVIPAEEVTFLFTDGDSSCLITPSGDDSTRYVVMPMRL